MDLKTIPFLGIYIFSLCLGNFGIFVIRSYHIKKPLGMQTFLGKVIILCTKVMHTSSTWWAIHLMSSELVQPMNELASITFTFLGKFFRYDDVKVSFETKYLAAYFTLTSWYIMSLLVLATRYLSIYQSSIIASLDEELIILIMSLIVFILPLILGIFEYYYITDIKAAIAYQLLHRDKDHAETSVELIRTSITVLDLILITFLQIRIEYDHIAVNDQQGCLASLCKFTRQKLGFFSCLSVTEDSAENSNGKIYYNIKAIRGFFALGIITAIVLGYHLTIGNSNTRNNYLLLYVLYTLVCPWIFIWHHPSMKTMAKNKMKHFCTHPYIDLPH